MLSIKRFSYLGLLFLLSFLNINELWASVTMQGNRIIYPAQSREKTLQFSNDDDTPYLIQVWLDINNAKSTPETADAPFIASPQIFRMNPHSGQSVRLTYVGEALPKDRESLFYLNYLNLPALKGNDKQQNKLVLLVTNRVKVFYRPEGLSGNANHVIDQLQVQYRGKSLFVNNPTPYYASISQATLLSGSKRTNIDQADMIPPYSQATWLINGVSSVASLKVVLKVVNDYGAEVSRTLNVTR
jgi:fimbrial chaperone protein